MSGHQLSNKCGKWEAPNKARICAFHLFGNLPPNFTKAYFFLLRQGPPLFENLSLCGPKLQFLSPQVVYVVVAVVLSQSF